MAPKNKLDKFFAAKDKKKQKETKTDVQKDDDDDEVAKEVGIEFGITGDFSGRTIKLTKEGAIESDESLLGPQEAEPTKTWKGKDEAAREAEIAAKALAEQRAKEEEAKKPQLGVYRPGQGAMRRTKDEPVSIGEEQFPALGEATKFKSAEDYQKSLQKPAAPTNAFKARATPANAWSSQSTGGPATTPVASEVPGSIYKAGAGSAGAYKPPGSAGGAYQPPGGGLFKK